jgi:hypothetical protein
VALVAQVLVEAQLPVRAQPRVPAEPLVPASLSQEAERPALAPPVLSRVRVLAQVQVVVVLARLVVVEARRPRPLLSRQLFSAAMARSTTSPPLTSERAPRSR